jgi:hypothetical protein
VHGFSREMELREAKDQGVNIMINEMVIITGYAAGIGIFGHAVAKSKSQGLPQRGDMSIAYGHEMIVWRFSEQRIRIAVTINRKLR